MFVLFNTVLVVNILIIWTPVRPIRWLAIPNVLISFYTISSLCSLMRIDIIWLLVGTYEFWFVTVSNFVTAALLSVYLPGLRSAMAWSLWFGYQFMAMTDAIIASQREFLLGTIAAAVFTSTLMWSVTFNIIDGVNNFALFQVNGHTLRASDVILNGLSTQLVILVISRYVGAPKARRILEGPDQQLSQAWRMGGLVAMNSGVLLTVLSFIPTAPLACRLSGLSVTLLFCLLCGAMYYRRLLRYLVLSFEFAFLSTQFSLIHLCLCDLLRWDSRSIPVISCWIWIHWVLTFDCMPPAIKAKCGFRYRFVVWMAMLFVMAHLAAAWQIGFGRREALRDRALVSFRLFSSHVELRVLPTMLSRMLVTFGWSCRIVWRLWRRKENELLIIQGTVTYLNNRRKLKKDEEELHRKQTKERRHTSLRKFAHRVSRVAMFQSKVAPSTESLTSSMAPAVTDVRRLSLLSPVEESVDASRSLAIATLSKFNRVQLTDKTVSGDSADHSRMRDVSLYSTIRLTPVVPASNAHVELNTREERDISTG
ncbi:hypothetical protein Poli38472_003432 [Pythium oligandrum]|uniref:Transmembrane protein n=1 Tax=Pythium oligandrum TaxID=41045 RepID=A0A8K1C7M3_PYTOL|nr:hypothetical protein Poli38472_003432 [Pythium oligandrum]|eukprot:TMW57507.1 hypothetical protein Poli38472_003432 [Pythium oligandrum]